MKKKKIKLSKLVYSIALGALLTGFVGAQKTFAQQTNYSTIVISNQKLPQFETYSEFGSFNFNLLDFNISSTFMKSHLNEWLGLDDDHSFELVKQFSDELGFTHSVYQHYYKDTKVQDELVILHEKNNILTSLNGQISSNISISNTTAASLETVKKSIKNYLNTENEIVYSDIEQVIVPVSDGKTVQHHYATKITGADYSKLNVNVFYVDG